MSGEPSDQARLSGIDAAAWACGSWHPDAPERIAGVTQDSRTVTAGDLYVAIPGERFDGHDFVADALARGAAGAVVREGKVDRLSISGRLLEVKDTLCSLGALAGGFTERVAPFLLRLVHGVLRSAKLLLVALPAARMRGGGLFVEFGNGPLVVLSDPGEVVAVLPFALLERRLPLLLHGLILLLRLAVDVAVGFLGDVLVPQAHDLQEALGQESLHGVPGRLHSGGEVGPDL